MNNKLVVLSDDHVRVEEPFFQVKKDFFEWCLTQEWNNETNLLLHCGDLFHSNLPNPKEIDLVIDFLHRSKFKGIILMSGNGAHEFYRPKKSYAIDALANIDRVMLVKIPITITPGNLNILLLPWVPNRFYDRIDDMKTYYENLPDEFSNPAYNYVFGHFAAKAFFDNEIDIDYLHGNKRMGHIHFPDEMYLGASTITRKDEQGFEYHVNLIDMKTGVETLEPIPVFLDYIAVEYPDIPDLGIHQRIYEIFNAPSKEIAREHYKGYNIHSIHLKDESTNTDDSETSDKTALSVMEYMKNFIKEKKIKPPLSTKLIELIKEVS